MTKALRDPRARILLAVFLALLVFALVGHLVAMSVPGMAMMIGVCLAVAAVASIFLCRQAPVAALAFLTPTLFAAGPDSSAPVGRGRYPPDEGTVLRL